MVQLSPTLPTNPCLISLPLCVNIPPLVQRSTIFRYLRFSVLLLCLNPTMRQLHYFWLIPRALVPGSCLHEGSWAMLVLMSSVFLTSVLPDVQGPKIVFQLEDQLYHYQ